MSQSPDVAGGIVERLESELRVLEEARAAESTAERRAAITGWIILGTILAILGSFLLANYIHFKSEWTEEKFMVSMRNELATFNPTAMAELHSMGASLLPVYAEEGKKQFAELSPEIARQLGEQVGQLKKDLARDVRAKLHDTEERIRQRATDAIFAAYPALEDPAEQAALDVNLRKMTEETVLATITDFDVKFSRDVLALEEVILSFDPAEYEDVPSVELQKKFIRSWLRLLDEEIKRL